ncbi:MAG: tetratricopeptide repeat protein, partial [Candidatus Tectomicrobia bacterium]
MKRDRRFFALTEGLDGQTSEFEILYTFGFHPLQQYLVALPDGRFQALDIAWDVDGSRWFKLLPEMLTEPGDQLHWTGSFNRWNTTCADCHSTNLRKGFDPESNSFSTAWSAINVGCQACHGPGAAHVNWARDYDGGEPDDNVDKGLQVANAEITVCAQCHSRRQRISEPGTFSGQLLDEFVPALLRQDLYHADGQILDEVYVYGSFVQSRMYRAGVRCSDCHDSHSGQMKAEGNAVCTQCHQESPPARFPALTARNYDTTEHHNHEAGSSGAKCVSCHMPTRTYMEIDPRRDHSLRIPRPDLSLKLGVPNACTQCHSDRTNDWASKTVDHWFGDRHRPRHYGEVLQAARLGLPNAPNDLVELITDRQQPAIVRATGLSLLPSSLGPMSLAAYQAGLADEDPLVRMAAVRALEPFPLPQRWQAAAALLADPVRAVRIEAAQLLAAVPRNALNAQDRGHLDAAVAEYIGAQKLAEETPEANLNLGDLHASMNNTGKAESAYRKALEIELRFVPAIVNLADLYRELGQDDEGAKVLQQGIERVPDSAEIRHALGLLKVRQGASDAAFPHLRKAVELDPDNLRYKYVLGIALNSHGFWPNALKVLREAHQQAPSDRDILYALTTISRDQGETADAIVYARK